MAVCSLVDYSYTCMSEFCSFNEIYVLGVNFEELIKLSNVKRHSITIIQCIMLAMHDTELILNSVSVISVTSRHTVRINLLIINHIVQN